MRGEPLDGTSRRLTYAECYKKARQDSARTVPERTTSPQGFSGRPRQRGSDGRRLICLRSWIDKACKELHRPASRASL